jgi:hypothetical protein
VAAIVSLIQLLEIGRLGPLHAGVSLRDAATLLGPPVSCAERYEPLHGNVWVWHYGELKLVFGIDTPWPLLFFAVEELPAASEATLIVGNSLGPAMVIELDGIDEAMRPTGALALIRPRGEPSQILYWPLGRDDTLEPSLLIIAAGDVAVSFKVWDDEIGGNAELPKLTDAELWRALEANASIDRVMCGMPTAAESGLAVVPRRLSLPPCSIAPRSEGATIASSVPARVVPRTARVRLADFLATGRLGPVHCGLSRNQVAMMLGPPDGWIGAPIDEGVLREGAERPARIEPEFPAYWFYGKLELGFDPERPHAMHFFQIESAGGLSGDCEVIAGGKIVLELEGLSGRSRPAEFLRMMWNGARPLHVIYSRPSNTGSFVLQIVSGSVIVVFDFEFPDEIVSDLAALDEAAYLRQCDRVARLDSIYAYPKPDGPLRSDTKISVTAATYLAAMT